MDWLEILTQGIGFLGVFFAVIAFQSNRHKNVMLLRTLSELSFAVQYVLLGAYTGAGLDLISCVRNQLFARQVKDGRSTVSTRIVFCVIMAAIGILTWEGPQSLLPLGSKLVSTIAYGMKDLKKMRLLTLPTSLSWLVYNVFCRSYAGIVCEAFTSISILIAIYRYDIKKGTVK